MKCYVTYETTYAIEIPDEDLDDLCYDEEEDGLLWGDEYDPDKVIDYLDVISIDWSDWCNASIEQIEIGYKTITF